MAQTVKARKQGNSMTLTAPVSLGVKEGEEYEPIRVEEGILFKVVKKVKDDFDFDEFIMRDLFEEGLSGQEFIDEFERRKGNIPKAIEILTQEALDNGPMTKEEFERAIGLYD
jgi:hypothetical protein